jgi:hypothetical protein
VIVETQSLKMSCFATCCSPLGFEIGSVCGLKELEEVSSSVTAESRMHLGVR